MSILPGKITGTQRDHTVQLLLSQYPFLKRYWDKKIHKEAVTMQIVSMSPLLGGAIIKFPPRWLAWLGWFCPSLFEPFEGMLLLSQHGRCLTEVGHINNRCMHVTESVQEALQRLGSDAENVMYILYWNTLDGLLCLHCK